MRLEREVRGRVAERAAALVARDDDAVELVRAGPASPAAATTSPACSACRIAGRRDARHGLDLEDLEAEPLEQLEIAAAPRAEAEVGSGGDRLGADRPQVPLGEHLGLERHQLRRERRDERRLGSRRRRAAPAAARAS